VDQVGQVGLAQLGALPRKQRRSILKSCKNKTFNAETAETAEKN